ncbi:sigma-54-dependent Fis family transcriptional regulator [Roseixanthobacter glucoisosaccharinicivorans]|uniref:sigma-54-dependent Fis family transcriptional regulator n=1 Tax=Roseixanthobacter glucoisosaccharinicivorans TaxID=3119923 RepID=UPI00372B58BF
MEQGEIRAAWETFQVEGRKPRGIPAAVAASWERSHVAGVGAGRTEAPLAGEPEIFRRRSSSAALLAAARPALQRSGVFLAEAASMMILADPSGFIVETAGDPRVVDTGRRNHLQTGGSWEEGTIGTNAIGTALADGRAIQICGAEHYCEDVQRWTCAAVPVRHPIDGALLGVVDISGPAESFHPQSLALAVAIGQEIEASLGKTAKMEHEILLRHFVSKRSIWLTEQMLVVDRHGFLVHAAQKTLDAIGPESLAADMRRMIGSAGLEAWEENCRRRFPNASLELVKHDNAVVGCLLVMHGGRRRALPAPPPASSAAAEAVVGFDQIIGESLAIRAVRERARKLAANALPILIEGETGVGKELFARAIKGASPVAHGPFMPVNCGGMARDLIASELFGYAKGAFTGADEHGRAGKIEKADGGTLCLDEIGEMPLDLQSYLLRVLEDGVVYRVGEHEGRRVNIRILAMTNRDLLAEVEAGRFRRDLYYRIAAARLRIPPLRERPEDIAPLAEKFAAAAARRLDRPAPAFSQAALQVMQAYGWPGNIRELRNVVDTMVALAESDRLEDEDLPLELRAPAPPGAPAFTAEDAPRVLAPAIPAADLKAAERAAILAQVQACGGNLTEAARRLGIARSTLYVRLAEYGDGRAPKS